MESETDGDEYKCGFDVCQRWQKKNTLEYTYLCKQETGQSRSADCTSSVVAKVVTFCVEIEVSKRKVM